MAVAGNRQYEAFASVIVFVFLVYIYSKHPKYLRGLFGHGHCISHKVFSVHGHGAVCIH